MEQVMNVKATLLCSEAMSSPLLAYVPHNSSQSIWELM